MLAVSALHITMQSFHQCAGVHHCLLDNEQIEGEKGGGGRDREKETERRTELETKTELYPKVRYRRLKN